MFRIIGSLPDIIGFYMIGTIFMLGITYFCVSFYSFCIWDWSYVENLWGWLHPKTNLWVRIGAIMGFILATFGGVMKKEIVG